jgi:predicted Fe-Mo cluster-binding NifX family protein
MRICVTAFSDKPDAAVDPRFGRCRYFIILDSETMNHETVENAGLNATSGAGIQAAQTIANKEIDVVITGHIGPNAFNVLSAAGIKTVTGASGLINDVVERYKRGELRETNNATVGGHFGMGRGGGRGRAW